MELLDKWRRKMHLPRKRTFSGLPKKDRNISSQQPNPKSIKTGGTTTKTAQSK